TSKSGKVCERSDERQSARSGLPFQFTTTTLIIATHRTTPSNNLLVTHIQLPTKPFSDSLHKVGSGSLDDRIRVTTLFPTAYSVLTGRARCRCLQNGEIDRYAVISQ